MRMKPLGGPYITRTTVIAAFMVAIMGILVLIRLCFGLRSVTNLNDGFPWGLWLAYDMVAGSAIGCGGYAVALVVYVLNKGQYHPLVRPAILASMFGYALGGVSVLVDISRWWNAWHIVWPAYFNLNSVMIEVALCVSVYTMVLMLEFAPPVVEKAVEWTGRWGGDLREGAEQGSVRVYRPWHDAADHAPVVAGHHADSFRSPPQSALADAGSSRTLPADGIVHGL
jgi:Ni/Fe-hydrogenase subunit HybB-like protein